MQSKGFIKLIAVLLALACVYQLSFTFKTRGVEKQAAAYAAQFPLDQQGEAEQHYLDSVQNLPVYNLGFRKFTYKECKEKELNLGLDLKGGMNVMLEVQVEDVVKALAGDSQNDPAFIEAIGVANEAMKQGSSTDYISDFVKAYSRLSNGRPIAELFVSPDRKDITLESSDADVEKILKKETEAAIGASFNVLRPLRRYAAQHPAPPELAPHSGRASGREGAAARPRPVAGNRFAGVLDHLRRQ